MANKGRTPNNDELSLWQKVVKGVTPWRDEPQPASLSPSQKTKKISKKTAVSYAMQDSQKPTISKNLDRRTEEKLTKGKMPIESTLDLHGMTQNQAHKTLNDFLTRSYQSGKRCVLVITGKGSGKHNEDGIVSERREKGVLRARLPDWLAMNPLNHIVLRHVPAHQKHGGSGAFYIYLKSNKN